MRFARVAGTGRAGDINEKSGRNLVHCGQTACAAGALMCLISIDPSLTKTSPLNIPAELARSNAAVPEGLPAAGQQSLNEWHLHYLPAIFRESKWQVTVETLTATSQYDSNQAELDRLSILKPHSALERNSSPSKCLDSTQIDLGVEQISKIDTIS